MTTWTPRALASEAAPYAGDLWRVVEAQYLASTMRLADSLADQAVLEAVLEESKPKTPAGAEKLHYLLATPFRYRPHLGSRFRAPLEPGVWYGAEHLRTALAEKSYWRLRFLLDAPRVPDLGPVPHSAFTASVRASSIDLTMRPFARDRVVWIDRASYARTQAFAATAREARIEIIRYESVRDPEHAACAALLTPAAFQRSRPRRLETWFIAAGRERVRCAQDVRGGTGLEFTRGQLIGD